MPSGERMSNIEIFLKSIQIPGESKTLTKIEEINLGELIQDPTTSDAARLKAINTLVIKNVYLVLKLVHNYKRTAFEFDDLVGYGILGLFSAARKYDPSRGIRFASYARHWIKESVMKAVREYSGTPKIPVYLVKDLWAVARALNLREDATDEEISRMTGLEEKTVTRLKGLLFKTVQFDQNYTELDHNTPEHVYIQYEQAEIFHNAMSTTLTADEQTVLNYSYELNGCKRMTFASIEQEFGIKNARKVKASAMAKLSNNSKLRSLHKES